jgi:hypothetical protein
LSESEQLEEDRQVVKVLTVSELLHKLWKLPPL